jgi:hypothetical protein
MSVASCVSPHLAAAMPTTGGGPLAYAGTDTKPANGAASGEGIYLFEMGVPLHAGYP